MFTVEYVVMFNPKKTASTIILMLFLSFSTSTFLVFPAKAAENSWVTLEPMPTARNAFGVAVVDGKIYAIGGYNASYLSTNEMYDPITDTWSIKKSMPTARAIPAIAVYQNKIYVIGGIIGESDTSHSGFTGITEVYDTLTDTWETMEQMPTARAALCANVVDEKIYLVSGMKYAGVPPVFGQLTDINEVYDPSTDSWSTKTPIPTSISYYPSAVVDNKIYLMGGTFLTNIPTQIYNPETDTWNYGKTIPTAVFSPAAGATTGLLAPKRIYVFGGQVDANIVTNLTQVYDPENDTWTTGTPMPTPRWSLGVAVVDDELYVIGGKTGEGNNFSAVNEKYTPLGYIPEFPSWTILPLLLVATLVAILCKKRLVTTVSNI
jgi:N-acetylneuraminic acid mutarotase